MTDRDRDPDGTGNDHRATGADDASGTDQETSTARTRRRGSRGGRGRRGRGSDGAAETSPRRGGDDRRPETDVVTSDRDADERGAAEGGSDDESDAAEAGSGESTNGATDGSGGGPARRRRRGRRGRGRGKGSAGRDDADDATGGDDRVTGGAEDGTDAPESDDPDDESAVERAIARGGTRMAAKQGTRRSGGGGGGGRRAQQRPGGVPEEVRRAILEGPPRTMLVTAREDRTQIAVMEDRKVVEHYVTRKADVTFVGNIYMARVQNVLPGMEAAFLDIGKGRNGVLYAGEVLYDELDLEEGADERIENVLKPGQQVLVQVTKDPMGSKGPRLTMHLSLAGRYMVLAPNSDLFGISRKLTDRERDRLRRIVKRVKPEQHGVIVRTAAEGASEEQITADVERLLGKWRKVEEAAQDAKALSAVYEEPPLVVKVIRDNFGPEFLRCIVDDDELFQLVRDYLDEVAPELLDKVELYGAVPAGQHGDAPGTVASGDGLDAPSGSSDEPDTPSEAGADAATRRAAMPPLFEAYDVADQLRKAMGRKVWLPSGGYLIIESTEAMKVIDVNTGKFTGGKGTNLEEVVLKTNLEAADEIVRQLRLRDMGGIIVIDFIDMLLKANQDQVVRRLKRELLRDRTKTRVSEVSRLGLVQMTRKNVSQGLIESFSHVCEHCEGRGIVSEIE